VEAHALVSLNRIVHGSYRDADMSRKFSAVDRTPDATGQDCLDIPVNFEMPDGVRARGPPCLNNVGECGIDSGNQGLAHRGGSVADFGGIEARRV